MFIFVNLRLQKGINLEVEIVSIDRSKLSPSRHLLPAPLNDPHGCRLPSKKGQEVLREEAFER